MSQPLEGLQFPIHPKTNKASSSAVGQAIIAAALKVANPELAQQLSTEKNWRKTYPHYFKALVQHGIANSQHSIEMAQAGLDHAYTSFDFYQDQQKKSFQQILSQPKTQLNTVTIKGKSQQAPTWFVPYQGQQLQGDALLAQIQIWQDKGIMEASHADALRLAVAHPEWFDLSDRTMVLFGAASEAGPLTWLAQWKANIVAVDLASPRVWQKILSTVEAGNATLYAPTRQSVPESEDLSQLSTQLGANLLTETPEIIAWLSALPQTLDLAAIAYLDGEKHVRVALAMDSIMQQVSLKKPDSSLMFMCTPTDIYAIPKDITEDNQRKFEHRPKLNQFITHGISTLSRQFLFQANRHQLIDSNNGQQYGIADCLVLEQGPNYALAKRLQQWRAVVARQQGQTVSINVAPSTTTHSVTKNPLLKAAFDGASLFDVEAFAPETTNAIMAALWIHDLRHTSSVAHANVTLAHPLELMMSGANHGGLWRVPYLARTALPLAALYGFAQQKMAKIRGH